MESDKMYLSQATDLAREGIRTGRGGPFGCVIVRNGEVIGQGSNAVTSTNDPTAHAEIVAIREACRRLGHHQLTECTLYASCEPCPMCLGAIYWARPVRVVYGATRRQAAAAGFDDDLIYREIGLPQADRKIPFDFQPDDAVEEVFEMWRAMGNKTLY